MKNKVEINSFSFVLEPSYKKDGSLHSWEILTKNIFKKNTNAYQANEMPFSFDALNEKEIIDAFNKQLLTIEKLEGFHLKFPLLSLNVDSLISDYILTDKYVSEHIKRKNNIALEINENFHEFKSLNCMSDLKKLSRLGPLWLDDFGGGLTSLKVIELFKFECVKIDKDYFWEIQNKKNLMEIINKIKVYCNFLIVEGVETIEQKNIVFSVNDSACQGRLWKKNYHNIEC
ncbi:EAL domain-containing protein [Klebsiella pneumoniae]|nr:EAL domain-containing protein [Klebsiella pneumoniae]